MKYPEIKDIKISEEITSKWQNIVDILADIMEVPAALIMKVDPPKIQVFRTSQSQNNPYEVGDEEYLSGLYCERVITSDEMLHIPNALKDERWKENPDVELGMISYLGFPIKWPDGDFFGTICVLDSKERRFKAKFKRVLKQYKDLVESQLKILFQNKKLKKQDKRLTHIIEEQNLLLDNIETQIWYLKTPEIHGKVNQARAEFMGFKKEEIRGSNYYELYSKSEDAKVCVENNKKVFTEKKPTHTLSNVENSKGESRILSVSKYPKLNNNNEVEYIVCTAIDVTERQNREKELKLTQFSMENASLSIFWMSPAGEFLNVNKTA